MKYLAVTVALALAACGTTGDVQERCALAEDLVRNSALAPTEVRAAVAVGARLCQDPRYAALRERVTQWLRDRK